MGVAAPPSVPSTLLERLAADVRSSRRASGRFPPGEMGFSFKRTRTFEREPLPMLLSAYERFGPVFTLRLLHTPVVFALGPAANHYITVSNASNFRWREGSMGDLIPLLGDGLLTTDGDYHRRARRIMLPAFHRDQIAAATDTMVEETGRALASWRPGMRIDLYAWTRRLALRVAMRALFGFDPDRADREFEMAEEFERALGFWGTEYVLQMLRGPRSPWWRMQKAREHLDGVIFAEIERRRSSGERGMDILSLLLDATDEDGSRLSRQELRDQVMTLLFAGHDTTTSTVTFLFFELARARDELEALRAEHDSVLAGERAPSAGDLVSGLPQLEMALDETLRMYPPAWVGPRRSIEPFHLCGADVPGGVLVNYCSWASHHLPEVFPEPERFRSSRFAPEARARLPRGAYVPFGGGSRTCIGMRFAQLEIKAIASGILARWDLDLAEPERPLSIRQMPTLSPRGGLPVLVRERS
ncbi:MAG TPA: cytochrome P450 [Thermoleophilaceae bacterium]|nr:cytochrome P450 [Thermoleophilaceae bacterium]